MQGWSDQNAPVVENFGNTPFGLTWDPIRRAKRGGKFLRFLGIFRNFPGLFMIKNWIKN